MQEDLLNISIHSLVKRETAKQDYDIYVIDIISIHSLVKRETNLVGYPINQAYRFQSTPS